MNALAVKAIATTDKAQRCGIGRDLLPLFDRQLAIAETCKADDPAAREAARTNRNVAKESALSAGLRELKPAHGHFCSKVPSNGVKPAVDRPVRCVGVFAF